MISYQMEIYAMEQEIHHYRRFRGYDYRQGASLFISISTEPRMDCFGTVRNAKVLLSPLGTEVFQSIKAIPRFNPDISLFGHVLMPDHTHFRVYLPPNLPEPLKILGNAMRKFKTYTTTVARKKFGMSQLWQQGYHDWLCLSRNFIESVERYIAYNPLKYELFNNQPELFHVVEPLIASRLDPADYWKGIGNISLLSTDMPIASLRVSRSIQDFRSVLSQVAKLVEEGYAILSGFISPGEIAVRDMLIANPHAKIIHILTESMPYSYKPDSRYLLPLQEGRFLEIARGNAPAEFSRQTCLDLNQEIIEIAQAGLGKCLYFA